MRRVFARLSPQTINQYVTRSRHQLFELNQTHGALDSPHLESDLDPLPWVLSAEDHQTLQTGLAQWGDLATMAYQDFHGPQTWVGDGLIPSALLWETCGFNHQFHQALPSQLSPISLIRIEVQKTTSGHWRILGLGTGLPRGLGLTIEARIVQTRVFGSKLPRSNVVRLAPFFQNLKDQVQRAALTHKDEPSIMVWTPGPSDHRYAEHGYLSRYFGFPLVESRDLTVRQGRVYLKLLGGLQAVDVLIRLVPDSDFDPLASASSSAAGVAGLLQTVRDGLVVVINAPGSDCLEHPDVLPHLAKAGPRMLNQPLLITPLQAGEIGQSEPYWDETGWAESPGSLTLFGAHGPEGWAMLPGGFATLVRPGLCKEVWVLSDQSVPFSTLLPKGERPSEISRSADLPSRVADDLFWLGKYAERAWVDKRYVETWLELADAGGEVRAQSFLRDCLVGLELGRIREEDDDPLIADWRVAGTIAELDRVYRTVRERFSLEAQRILGQFVGLLQADQTQPLRESLDRLGLLLSAFSGISTENMTRSSGWRFLDMGRRIERAQLVLESLAWFFQAKPDETVLGLLLELFDSIMTYRARYRLLPQPAPTLDLLLLDETNPRSVAYQLVALQAHVEALSTSDRRAFRSAEERISLDLLTRLRLCDASDLLGDAKAKGKSAVADFLTNLNHGLDELSSSIHRTYLAKLEVQQVMTAKGRIDRP